MMPPTPSPESDSEMASPTPSPESDSEMASPTPSPEPEAEYAPTPTPESSTPGAGCGVQSLLVGLLLSLLIGLPVFTLFAPDSLVGLLLPALRPTLGDTFLGFRDAARQAFDLDQGEGSQDEPTPEGTEPPPSTDGDQPSGGGSNEGNQSGGEPPTEEPTSEPSADLCANNGGVQWVGEVCVCAGVVDKVTVCNDGTKFDNVTEQTCPPDPAACQDDGSGGDQGGGGSTGDGDACKDSCGNGTCEPNCGEDSWTCSRDCGPG